MKTFATLFAIAVGFWCFPLIGIAVAAIALVCLLVDDSSTRTQKELVKKYAQAKKMSTQSRSTPLPRV
jgi:hypothetical protein